MNEAQSEALKLYLSLDRICLAAKGGHCLRKHPLDVECRKAYADFVALFVNQMEANDALDDFLRPPVTPRASAYRVRQPRATRSAAVRDPRIPAPGTVIEKRDRHGAVLATATVLEDGIEYAGTRYGSPSAAGLAASRVLGLGKVAVDGYKFWNLGRKSV